MSTSSWQLRRRRDSGRPGGEWVLVKAAGSSTPINSPRKAPEMITGADDETTAANYSARWSSSGSNITASNNFRSLEACSRWSSSFRSNQLTMSSSSTASSPGAGYTFIRSDHEEIIDPSTYSFTTALRALQARPSSSSSGCLISSSNCTTWECSTSSSPAADGFAALNSKWNEAEKYICNPISGEVPVECLSAKAALLVGERSFRSLNIRRRRPVTTAAMSGPLVYYPSRRSGRSNPHPDHRHYQDKGNVEPLTMTTRDVGTQSTPPNPKAGSPIKERSLIRCQVEKPQPHTFNTNNAGKTKKLHVEATNGKEEMNRSKDDEMKEKVGEKSCRSKHGGCWSWGSLWMRKRQREKAEAKKG